MFEGWYQQGKQHRLGVPAGIYYYPEVYINAEEWYQDGSIASEYWYQDGKPVDPPNNMDVVVPEKVVRI